MHAALDQPRVHIPKDISIGSAVFAQLTANCPYTIQWAAPLPLIIAPSHRCSGPHLIHGFFGHQSPQTNDISIGSEVFAGLTIVTDRQTDHATRLVTIGRIYVRSTAMRPNNEKKLSYRKQIACPIAAFEYVCAVFYMTVRARTAHRRHFVFKKITEFVTQESP